MKGFVINRIATPQSVVLRWLFWLRKTVIFVALGLSVSAFAQAPHASIERIEPLLLKDYLALDIDADLQLSQAMREALNRGVPLTFQVAVEIGEPRWWWFDRMLVDARLHRRISFNTLTRQWRVSIGDLGLTVSSFEEAMDLVSHVRGWEVAPSDRFATGKNYEGRVRIQLDMSQVSRALQLDAGKRDWNLVSEWLTFQFQMDRDREAQP